MTARERVDAARRLEEKIPAIRKNYPDGWKDFRQPLPAEWRTGMYVKVPENPIRWSSDMVGVSFYEIPDLPEEDMEFYSRFASLRIACEVAMQIRNVCQCGIRIEALNNTWKIWFSVPAKEVCW